MASDSTDKRDRERHRIHHVFWLSIFGLGLAAALLGFLVLTARTKVDPSAEVIAKQAQTALPGEVFGNPISKEADEYLTEASHSLKVKQETFRTTYLSDVTWYDMDLDKGIIRFERGGRPPLLMDVQVVGSVRHSDKSWEWAWSNPNVPHALSRDSAKVKEIGQRYDLRYLVRGLIPMLDENFPWYLTGIALHESQALGVYVSHAQESDIYMLLTNPRDGAS